MENYTNRSMGNAVPDTGLRSDIRRGIDNTTRALDVDNDTRLNTNANMNTKLTERTQQTMIMISIGAGLGCSVC